MRFTTPPAIRCGNNSPFPCDDDTTDPGHGTHTAGTFAGDDGASASPRHQIGVAPGAKWIGCRNMESGHRHAGALHRVHAMDAGADRFERRQRKSRSCAGCCQQFLVMSGNRRLHDRRWHGSRRLTRWLPLAFSMSVAAQNSGPGCSTILDAPAIYDASFDVGATDSSDALAGFSSRGSVQHQRTDPARRFRTRRRRLLEHSHQ